MNATKMYDKAAHTVRDLVEEIPDLATVKDVAEDLSERAGDWVSDTGDRLVALLPGAAAKAARRRRRRWILAALGLAVIAVMFGPGGAERRAALKKKLGMDGSGGTSNPSFSTASYREPVTTPSN